MEFKTNDNNTTVELTNYDVKALKHVAKLASEFDLKFEEIYDQRREAHKDGCIVVDNGSDDTLSWSDIVALKFVAEYLIENKLEFKERFKSAI